MVRPMLWGLVLSLGGTVFAVMPAWAGRIDVSPSIQTAVNVQNAQQIQVGYGVDSQEATLIQQQSQSQERRRARRPRNPRSPRYRRNVPGTDDIRVAPTVQTAVNVQNGQQIQVALPDYRSR